MFRSKHWLVAFLAAATFLAPASALYAQDAPGPDEAVDEGPIVRRKLLFRSTRVEVVPQAAFTINDTFRRNILAGLSAMYHLTNEFGIGASFVYGLLHLDTDLAQNVRATLEANNPGDLENISYTELQFAGDVSLSYVPIFGKFSLLKTSSVNYDIHLNLGASFVNEQASPAVDGGNVDAELESIRPGALVGVGLRLFFSDMISVNVELKNMIYSRAEVSRGTASTELSVVPMATVGVGIFFPGEVKISR